MARPAGVGPLPQARPRPEFKAPPRESALDALRLGTLEKLGRRIGFFDWAMRVPEPKAGTLDFRRFPFQLELYQQGAADKEMVIRKCTQVGISAYAVRWALYWTDTRRRTGLYVFPTLKDVYEFSSARIQPAIDGSDYLRARQRPSDPNSKGLRAIGGGFIYFRGSESKRGLDSVDADHLVFDEYDTLSQGNIPDAERRITGSQHGLIRRLGVPSTPDWGIDQHYQASDMRQWHTKCEACGEWQVLDFFENVDQVRALRVCRRCAKPLNVAKGEWVPEFPDRDVRGYHISRLISPLADMKQIIRASRKRTAYEKRVFFNKDLGLPFAEEEGRLSKEALAAAQREFAMVEAYVGDKLVTMGVDVASARDLNVRISEHIDDKTKKALFIGPVQSFDDLCRMMDRYQVRMAAIDHLPDGRLARSFAERFPGRVYLVSYDTTVRPMGSEVLKVNEEMRHVTARRTELIDATFELVRMQRNLLPINPPDDYAAQMQSNIRIVEKDEFGKQTVTYRATTPDDYAQAESYDVVASELFWLRSELDEAQRDTFKQLDEMLEFQRSGLADYAEEDYHGGPSESLPDGFFGPGEDIY